MATIGKPPNKVKSSSKGTKGQPVAETTDNLKGEELAALSVKISPVFKRGFKAYTAENDMSMRDLLAKVFESYRSK